MSNHYKFENLDLSKLQNRKIVCLTLDLEQDHGGLLEEPSYEAFSVIDPLIDFLKSEKVKLTCFVQGLLFETHPEEINKFKRISTEFGLHTYYHREYCKIDHETEVIYGKNAYKNYFNNDPVVYRSQAGLVNSKLFNILSDQNFKVDSSIIPSFRPGVYNGLKLPVVPHLLHDSQIMEFPLGTYSKLRIPISISYMKLLGMNYFNILTRSDLSDLLIFSFHLHDLKLIESSKRIPFSKFPFHHQIVFKKIYSTNNGMFLFKSFIKLLKKRGYEFLTLMDVYHILMDE